MTDKFGILGILHNRLLSAERTIYSQNPSSHIIFSIKKRSVWLYDLAFKYLWLAYPLVISLEPFITRYSAGTYDHTEAWDVITKRYSSTVSLCILNSLRRLPYSALSWYPLYHPAKQITPFRCRIGMQVGQASLLHPSAVSVYCDILTQGVITMPNQGNVFHMK